MTRSDSRQWLGTLVVVSLVLGFAVSLSAFVFWRQSASSESEAVPATLSTLPSVAETVVAESSALDEDLTVPVPAPVDLGVVFVAPDGFDSAEGGHSADTPVRSIQFAVGLADMGDTVLLAEGIYAPFEILNRSDVSIEVEDGAIATVRGDGYERQTGILIRDSNSITISGVAVTSVLRGIRIESSTDVTVDAVHVYDIGQEGVAFTTLSTAMVLRNSLIELTGRRDGDNGQLPYSAFGEGVYLGTGGTLEDGSLDVVTDVLIENNEIAATTAEAIDVKASVEGVVIRSNLIHDVVVDSGAAIAVGRGTRIYSADVLIEHNVIWNVETSGPFTDGNGILLGSTGVVRNNAVFNVGHRGILIDADLRSVPPAGLLVEGNWISNADLVAIEDRSLEGDVPVMVIERDPLESDALRSEFLAPDGGFDGRGLLDQLLCSPSDACE